MRRTLPVNEVRRYLVTGGGARADRGLRTDETASDQHPLARPIAEARVTPTTVDGEDVYASGESARRYAASTRECQMRLSRPVKVFDPPEGARLASGAGNREGSVRDLAGEALQIARTRDSLQHVGGAERLTASAGRIDRREVGALSLHPVGYLIAAR